MRQNPQTPLVILIIALAFGATGCQGKMQRHSFPAAWPSGLTWSGSAQNLAASPEPVGPAVSVETLTVDTEAGAQPREINSAISRGQPNTSRVLTDLMIAKLKQAGVRVSDAGAEYVFKGTVPKLGYTERGGYPRKFYYTSELVYQLIHRPSGTVVWKGNLSQDFEQTVVVNTMTRLPNDPDAPVRVLLDKCIAPNWEMIAADVKVFLRENPPASEQ